MRLTRTSACVSATQPRTRPSITWISCWLGCHKERIRRSMPLCLGCAAAASPHRVFAPWYHAVEWLTLYSSNGVVDGLCGLVWRSRMMCVVLSIIALGCMCIVIFKLEDLAVFRWVRGPYQWLPSLVNHAVSCTNYQNLEGYLCIAGQVTSIARTLGR